MAINKKQFMADYNEIVNKNQGQIQTALDDEKARFIADYNRINNIQETTAPKVTNKMAVQQYNYNAMQNAFKNVKTTEQYEKELQGVDRQINDLLAVQSRDAAERQQLKNLLEQRKNINAKLGNPTAGERAKLSAASIGKTVVASPVAAANLGWQVSTDPVEMEISRLERQADLGVLNAAGWARLNELKPQQGTKELNTSGWSWQKLREAEELRKQASKGFNAADQFAYDTAMSMATNLVTLPANLIAPGASLALMGTQSMANKALEVADNGGSAAEAFGRGLAAGGIEMLTEAVSLDTLSKAFKGQAGKTVIGKTINSLIDSGKISPVAVASLEQAFSEGGEELVSAIANWAVDKAAGDPDAKLSAQDLVLSFLGGAISGGTMGAGAYGAGRIIDKTEAVQENRTSESNSTKNAINAENIDSTEAINAAENRKQLEKQVKEIVGIDTRTESEKVAEKENSRVAAAEKMAKIVGASKEEIDRVKQSAADNIAEAQAKESLDNAVKLIEYVGKEADIYSDTKDSAAAYNTAERIGINLAHTDTTAMGRAVHEIGHDKTQNAQWADYTAAIDRLVASDGRLSKLMEDIKYAYENSPDEEIRASVRFADGTVNNAKIREEQYLKLTEIMLPNIAKGDKQLLDAIKKDRNVIDNLLDFIRGIKNKVSIKLTRSEAAMLDEAERQLVNLLRSESKTSNTAYSSVIDNNNADNYNGTKGGVNNDGKTADTKRNSKAATKVGQFKEKTYNNETKRRFESFDKKWDAEGTGNRLSKYISREKFEQIVSSPEFYARKNNGKYIDVFHGTTANYEHFKPGVTDIGIHLGNIAQAMDIISGEDNARIIKANIKINNPLFVAVDFFGGETEKGYFKDFYNCALLNDLEIKYIKEHSGRFYELSQKIEKYSTVTKENYSEISFLIEETQKLYGEFVEKANKAMEQDSRIASIVEGLAYVQNRNIENDLKHLGYDSIVYRNDSEGDKISGSKDGMALSYIVFDDGQIVQLDKNYIPQKPTGKRKNAQFSLSLPVEETKDLIAVHNLNEEKLASALKLGGLPSPSIAIVKAKQGHDTFGDITMVFDKATIDPKNKKNKVYGSDAWTPTKPGINYEVNTENARNFDNYIWGLSQSVFDGVFKRSSAIGSRINSDSTSNNYEELVEKIMGDEAVKAAYIAEKGFDIKPEYKTKQYHRYGNEALDYIKENLGEQKVAEYSVKVLTNDFTEKDESKIRQLLVDYWLKDNPSEKYVKAWTLRANKLSKVNIEDLVLATQSFIDGDGGAKSDEIDKWATLDKIDESIRANKADYESWLREKTQGVIGEAGIYNGKDPYTARGDKKSFWQLHNVVTLENLVKAMNSEADRGVGMFGGGAKALQATATPKYSSIAEIKADRNRLKKLSTEEHETILEDLDKRIDEVVKDIQVYNNDESYMADSIINDVLVAAAQTNKTPAAIIKAFKNESAYKISNEIANDIANIYNDVAQIPVSYFEAKPQRAVGFDEVKAVIIPENTKSDIKQQIVDNGMQIVEYDGTEEDRLEKLNSLEDVLFSIQTDIDANEYWGENSKSRAVERHAVNEFTNYVAELFGVEYKDKTEILKKQAWKLADAAKKTGVFSTQQMLDFFNDAYNLGKQEIGNLDQRNAELKKELHNLGIKPLKGREYLDFVQKYKGKIIFTNKGVDIDVAYKQLTENYPEWFSDDTTNPYDMMRRIGDVYDSIQGKKVSNNEYFGAEAEAFKSAAMEQYTALVDNFIDTMNSVSRYQLALADQKRQNEEAAKRVYTIEDVENARALAQPLLKEIARFDRKNLFTAEDRDRLKEMLKLSNPADVNRMQEYLRETNPLADEIIEMYEKKKMLESIQKPIFEYNKQRKARLKSQFLDILQTSDSWKDKGSGLAYMNNTFERNIDDIVTDKKAAEALKDILPRQIHKHVADATRYKNQLRNKIRGFNIDTNKTYNIEVEAAGEILKGEATEADLIQMYGEGIVTKTYLDKIGANTKKVVETADKFREIYNELFEKINAAYVANGYAPMEYRQDYFPHFFDDTGDTLLNKAAAFLGFDAKNMLPTEIAGRTHEFSPGRQWNSHALQRKGEKTDYNVLKGFDNYIEAAANIIHLTEDIQNLRAFENAIRYKYSDEGMKAELDAIDALTISETEKQEQREKILKTEDRNTKLNNFVVWEHEYTNLLAGKKSKADRWIEDMFGRRFYTVAKNIENRVSANMIAGNISSALTNFIPITQLTAEVDGRYIFTAMADTIKNMKNNDSFVDMSDFLTNRFGSEMLSLTKMQKAANAAGKPMELVDEFTSNVVTRARYLQNVDKGKMDSVSAMREADEYAASLMADRSKGALPTIFESKNPIIKLFTMFQVEQANQLNYMFKDLPRKKQEKAKGWLLWALIKLGIYSFLYNWMFEQIAGRKPAFSPVDMIVDTGKGIAQVKKGEMKASAALSNSFVRTMENLPYASSVLAVTGLSEDAGRIPVSGALPDFSQLAYLRDKEVSAEKKKAILSKELAKPGYYLAAPFAGGAAKKVIDTAELYGKNKGVQYSIQSDGSKKVQFANDPSVGAVAQSAVFGKWASKPAQEYINSGFKGLTKNQTKAFDALKNTGLKNSEATAMVKSIKEADANKNGYYTTEEAKTYINKLGLTKAQKAILFELMCPTVKNNPYK